MTGRVLGVLAVLALALAPLVVDPYTLSVLARTTAIAVLAVSVALLTGYAGLPTLGQVAPYAVGAYGAGLLARAGYTVGPVLLVAAAAAGALFALLTAPLVVRARGVTVLMITLALGELTATAAGNWSSVTGGTDGLAGVPPVQPFWGAQPMVDDASIYGYDLVVAVLVVGVTALVLRGRVGLLLTGAREHEVRMRATGHPVTRYLVLCLVAAGALAGIAGALLVSTTQFVSPGDVGFETATLVLLAVVIGGTTSVAGTLVGTVLVVAGQQWLSDQWPGHGPLLLGVLLVVAVYLLPRGVAGLSAPLLGRGTTR